MKNFRRKADLEQEGEINLSPLIDLVFILLIFFVVTTTFTRETGVEVKKPRASSVETLKDKFIKVAITREGAIHIFEKQVDLPELTTVLKQEKSRFPALKLVILADQNALTQRLVQVIDAANLVGIAETSIGVTR